MSWEQLMAIREQARRDAELNLSDPPEACPYDGVPLDVHPNGTRNCPAGNYTWRGEPKLI